MAWASVRSERFQDLVKAEPGLLFFRGRFLRAALRRERVTEEEVLAAMRAAGKPRLDAVEAVVLETDGSFSVIGAGGDGEPAETLRTVRRPDAPGVPDSASSAAPPHR